MLARQRKCRYRQAQTRSADEPMTTFVTSVIALPMRRQPSSLYPTAAPYATTGGSSRRMPDPFRKKQYMYAATTVPAGGELPFLAGCIDPSLQFLVEVNGRDMLRLIPLCILLSYPNTRTCTYCRVVAL